MCEFKVYSGLRGRQRLIAEEIIKAKLDKDSLVLTDILGKTTWVKGALVAEVDVRNEALRLYDAPLISEILSLLSFERLDRGSLNQLKSAWEALKVRGDQLIDSLKSTEEEARD